MTVENILNDEDRIEKIEDKLEIIFPKFDEDNFVLRFELVKKNKKSEDKKSNKKEENKESTDDKKEKVEET